MCIRDSRIISAIDKRQLRRDVLHTTIIITLIITASLMLLAFFMYIPVSYTHLDVYKRQVHRAYR